MKAFQDVKFKYKDEVYSVKSNNVFRLIGQIEEVISLGEILNPNPSMMKICSAFACCVNYAGGNTTGEKVYCHIFSDESFSPVDAVANLQSLMIPPDEYKISQGTQEDIKK